jgi:hypothetical protein
MFSSVHWLVNRDDRGVSFVIAALTRVGGVPPELQVTEAL